MAGVKVQRLDHVHIYVRDREAAEAWCGRVLGLVRHELADALNLPGGPILLSSDGGQTHIALFEARPGAAKIGARTVAFRIDGEGFLAFLDQLDELTLRSPQGRRVTREDVIDHGATFTVYFTDPDGNRFEVATYDHAFVREHLGTKEALSAWQAPALTDLSPACPPGRERAARFRRS